MDANVKVRVMQDFRDREQNLQLRKAGSVMHVSRERAYVLARKGLVKIDLEPDSEAKAAKKAPAKKK